MTPPPPPDWPCLRRTRAGLELAVQVVPNAGRTGVAGLHDGALRVRLSAPAIDGRANAALLKWLAESLDVPARAVMLAGGEHSRRKRILLDADEQSVLAWLRRSLPPVDRPS